MLIRPRLAFTLLALFIVTKLAIAQEQKGSIPSLLKPADAVARMDTGQARRDGGLYPGGADGALGDAVGQGGSTCRLAAAPLPQRTKRTPVDPSPHGINVSGTSAGAAHA